MGGIFRILFAGPGAKLFRVEDDGSTGIPNNGAFYFALPTKSVWIAPLNSSIFGGWKWLTAYNEVRSLESITMPAGTFRAFKIDRLIDYTIRDENIGFLSGLLLQSRNSKRSKE